MTSEQFVPVGAAGRQPTDGLTAVNFRHSDNLAGLLDELGISLLVSTYQAGKVFVIGSHAGRLQLRFHHFEQAMGLARTPLGLAVGTRRQVWTLRAAPEIGPRVAPAGTYDGCFLARTAHFTGPIMAHDLAWSGGELWAVNTLFSCLCTLDAEHSFVPRWRPPFVSALAAEDRCHLNGLAADDRGPRFATALGETDAAAGWRPTKATSGCLIDVEADVVVLRGLCMPHSPRLHRGQLYLLDSGRGQLNRCDPAAGQLEAIVALPGYTRGLDFFGRHAFVGLSRVRESNVFGGLPVAERRDELRCGVSVVDLPSSRPVAFLYFQGGVEEVFDVKVLPGFRNPVLSGPFADEEQGEMIWLAPVAPRSRPISFSARPQTVSTE